MASAAAGQAGLTREGRVGRLELRGDPIHTLAGDSLAALREAIRAAREDEQVRALVITGGPRVFCAGADVGLAQRCRDREFAANWLRSGNTAITELATLPKPTVCAVEGAAFGAGCNIPLACDVLLAGHDATFSQAFIKIGLATDMGSLSFLPRRIGYQRAREMMYTGRTVESREALDIGLIDERLPATELDARATSIAETLAHAPSDAFAAIKAGMAESGGADLASALETETRNQMEVFATDDFLEGTTAFLEKRPPRFGQGDD